MDKKIVPFKTYTAPSPFTLGVVIKGRMKGLRPFKNSSPSPYQGEGDKGGEVAKNV